MGGQVPVAQQGFQVLQRGDVGLHPGDLGFPLPLPQDDGHAGLYLLALLQGDKADYYIFFSQIRLTAQNQQLAEQLRQFDEQYRVITGNVEEARRFRHDLRQHLNVISELNQENRRAELTAYLERYTESYQALDSQPLIGFFAVDNILRHYLARAQSEGVRVQTELGRFEDGLGFDPTDITVLLGNLLENALEACRKIPRPEERSLSISLRQREGALLISLANSCPTGSAEFSSFGGRPPSPPPSGTEAATAWG